MFQSKPCPFEVDIEKATNENNLSEDWALIIQICDNMVNYSDGAKIGFKAIMKRLHHSVPRVVLQALTLLDCCVKNCDRKFLLLIASLEFTTEVRKLLGKMHPSAANKLKELVQKWSMEEFKDDSELCIIPALYYKLKSEGVEFPPPETEKKPLAPICKDPDAVTSQEEENDIIKAIEISLKDTGRYSAPVDQGPSDVLSDSAKPLPEPFKVRAIYDFDAAEDNELTIKIGEIVLVSDNSNSSWWKGSNHRGEGLFPANFVSEDLDFKPEEEKIVVESISVSEASVETPTEEIKIDENKIDTVLNWLNDVDPTEETIDPEDMVKLEKECYKMGSLIEEHLSEVDDRLARLNKVNDEIMSAFDLFHELSNKFSTLPTSMKLQSNMMQYPYGYQTLPHSMPPVPSNFSNFGMQGAMLSTTPVSSQISNNQNINKPAENFQVQQAITLSEKLPETSISDNSTVTSNTSATSTVTSPTMNSVIPPGAMMNPYGATNPMGGVFIPPGVPIPFPLNNQQGNYAPTHIPAQNYMGLPYQVHPMGMGPYIPYPYYYVNNSSNTAQISNTSTTPANSEPASETLNTSTTVSNVLNTTPSVSSYLNDLQQISSIDSSPISSEQILKPDVLQSSNLQVSNDGQTNTSTNGSDNS